jgi:hypothetical protein
MLRSAIYVPMTIIIVAKNSIPFYQCHHKVHSWIEAFIFLLISFLSIAKLCVGRKKLCKLQNVIPNANNDYFECSISKPFPSSSSLPTASWWGFLPMPRAFCPRKMFNSIKLMANCFLHLFAPKKRVHRVDVIIKHQQSSLCKLYKCNLCSRHRSLRFLPSRVISAARGGVKSEFSFVELLVGDVLMGNYAN